MRPVYGWKNNATAHICKAGVGSSLQVGQRLHPDGETKEPDMWLLIAFIAIPLIEIALFIQVGGAIGLWSTLAIVIATAMLGTFLVRQQGMRAMGDLRGSFKDLRDPTEPIAHGAMILFSAALLLTPGFFTDAVGFLLLVPGVRTAAIAYAKSRINIRHFEMGQGQGAQFHASQVHPSQTDRHSAGSTVIDGEYEDVSGTTPNSDGPSGWTRH